MKNRVLRATPMREMWGLDAQGSTAADYQIVTGTDPGEWDYVRQWPKHYPSATAYVQWYHHLHWPEEEANNEVT